MATVEARRTTVRPDVLVKFRGVGWKGFQHAKALVAEDPLRITYANGDLLLMSPGARHEAYVSALEDLVKAVGRAFRISTRSLRSTLWERRGAVERPTSLAFPMLESAKLLPLIERAALLEAWIRAKLRPPRRRRRP